MYRVSPFTYIVGALLSTGVTNHEVVCADLELLRFQPAAGQTCGEYMAEYMELAGGAVYNPTATSDCRFCSLADTNAFLSSVDIFYEERRQNIGLLWVYIAFNAFTTLLLYWLVRVPKNGMWAKVARLGR